MNEITSVYEEIKLIRERDRGLLAEAKRDIISKLAEIEKLKSQVKSYNIIFLKLILFLSE